MAGEGVLAATKRQLLIDDAMLLATISVTVGDWLGHGGRGGACSCHEHGQLGYGAGIFTRAADLANTLSETAATGPRTQSAPQSRPRDKHHRGLPKIARTQDSAWASEGREGQVRGPDVQHAVAADEGLSTLGRCPTSRGRAAHPMPGRPPRGPGSATIDLHLRPSPLIGKAFDGRPWLSH